MNEKTDMFHRIESAFDILHFTQNLIQFADNKANTLIVINSIFLASLPSLAAERTFMVVGGGFLGILRGLFFVASVTAVIYCLLVVMARKDNPETSKRPDLIFFDDIVKHKNASSYFYEYMKIGDATLLEDLARRNFNAAGIAQNKYNLYGTALRVTFASCLLWIACILTPYMTIIR
ncbi:MAG: hypothetical protein HYU64_14150 [Armatimonadetes bacterium]|nr:hypothetical protein [Armatimonadota bacterium]